MLKKLNLNPLNSKVRTLWGIGLFILLISLALVKFVPKNQSPYRAFVHYTHRIINLPGDEHGEKTELEAKLKSDPQSYMTRASLAALYLNEGKQSGDTLLYDRAEILAKESLKILKVFNDRAYLVLADVAQARHQFQDSVKMAKQILEEPKSRRGARIEAYSLLITSQLALGWTNDAAKSSDELNDLDPSVASYTLRALVNEAQGRDEEVLYDYQRAFHFEAFGNLKESAKLRDFAGRYCMRRGQYDDANLFFNEALKLQPEDPLTLSLLGELHLHEEKYEKAAQEFEQAFSVSKQTGFLIGEIRAKAAAGKVEESVELRTQTIKILENALTGGGPGSVNAYAHRTELLKLWLEFGETKEWAKALILSQEELKLRQNSESQYLAALALHLNKQETAARSLMRNLLDTGVKQAEFFDLASQIEMRLNDESKSNYYLTRMRETDSHYHPRKENGPKKNGYALAR